MHSAQPFIERDTTPTVQCFDDSALLQTVTTETSPIGHAPYKTFTKQITIRFPRMKSKRQFPVLFLRGNILTEGKRRSLFARGKCYALFISWMPLGQKPGKENVFVQEIAVWDYLPEATISTRTKLTDLSRAQGKAPVPGPVIPRQQSPSNPIVMINPPGAADIVPFPHKLIQARAKRKTVRMDVEHIGRVKPLWQGPDHVPREANDVSWSERVVDINPHQATAFCHEPLKALGHLIDNKSCLDSAAMTISLSKSQLYSISIRRHLLIRAEDIGDSCHIHTPHSGRKSIRSIGLQPFGGPLHEVKLGDVGQSLTP